MYLIEDIQNKIDKYQTLFEKKKSELVRLGDDFKISDEKKLIDLETKFTKLSVQIEKIIGYLPDPPVN